MATLLERSASRAKTMGARVVRRVLTALADRGHAGRFAGCIIQGTDGSAQPRFPTEEDISS